MAQTKLQTFSSPASPQEAVSEQISDHNRLLNHKSNLSGAFGVGLVKAMIETAHDSQDTFIRGVPKFVKNAIKGTAYVAA